MKQACVYVGSFILNALFVLFPILYYYSIVANWKPFIILLLAIIVTCEFGYLLLRRR